MDQGIFTIDSSVDIWVKGGTILTMDENLGILSPGDLWVKEGRILRVCKSNHSPEGLVAKKVLDAHGCLVLPGLINAHTHLPMSLLRGYSDDLPLKEWLFEHIFPAESRYMNPEVVYWGSLWASVELISSGITSVIDGYFFEEEVAKALSEAGLRGIVGQGILDFPTPDTKEPNLNIRRAEEFIENTLNRYTNIIPSLFCHSPLTVKEKTIKKIMDMAKAYNIPIQMHVSETKEEYEWVSKEKGLTPVAYVNSLGLLDAGLIAIHMVHVTDEDMELLRSKPVKVVHCPESNMKLSSGIAKVHEMMKMGIRVGLGTDSPASNNNLDLFREMDSAAKLQKVALSEATALPAKDALKMTTINGAWIMGMEDKIGSLSIGKEADFIVVELSKPHLFPMYDPYSLLVYSSRASDVRDVVVAGKVIMENRQITTLDVETIKSKIQQIGQTIYTNTSSQGNKKK